ncbi:MAG: hypothetical protein A2Y77_14085 [Planctomycetes bacterium RBG_13_62_9]|nr:MAG: hypothetical protein A2Y77_14085 [Planctomycetes bacterium RBG_13_62_9]
MRVLVVSEGKHEQSGALENLLRKLGAAEADLAFDRVSNSAVHAHHGKGPGYFKRALRWLMEAEKRGVDALILLIDEDGQRERCEQIQRAQESSLRQLPRAMGVAIRAFDAWMLADERALTNVLGRRIDRQPEPESIRDPKNVCEDLLANSQNQMAQREIYARIAEEVDVAVLSSRCQTGFRPFAGHVRQVFGKEQ